MTAGRALPAAVALLFAAAMFPPAAVAGEKPADSPEAPAPDPGAGAKPQEPGPGAGKAGDPAPGPGDPAPPDPAAAAAREEKEARERLAKLDPGTRKLLDLMDATHKTIESFSAEYGQTRKVRIRRNPVLSSGSIFVKKGKGQEGMKVLFVEEKPSRSRVLFTDTEVVFLDEATGEVKRSDPRQGSVRPSEIWILGRPVIDIVKFYTPKLLELEEKEKESYLGKLELVPVSEKIRKWVKRIVVWLRPDDGLGTKVRIEDHSGDYQEFDFDVGRLKINPELDEKLFVIE